MKRNKKNMRIILMALFSLCLMACEKRADGNREAESEYRIEDGAETENGIEDDEAITGDEAIKEKEAGEDRAGQSETGDVITAYLTENIEYTNVVISAEYVDDLSLIADMKYTDSTYAYQDGKVYYRRYHEDSYEETALWGAYRFVPETTKEIICIDSEGRETELFDDQGYGDIYLINNRFYMTDGKLREENGIVHEDKQLYSVDMQGNDRIDYGDGEILAIDDKRNMIILRMREQDGACYYAMNYETGERNLILHQDDNVVMNIGDYQDGWLYYNKYDGGISRLCAVSLEGEHREIIALTSDINKRPYDYREAIQHIVVDGERIYFIFGGYDGSACVFQGGKLISVKLDGTDYKAVETPDDVFYLRHENGKPLVYFPRYYYLDTDHDDEYDTTVWDVDANICAPSDFSENILKAYDSQVSSWHYYPASKGALCRVTLYEHELKKEETNVYAIPDDSGKIVRVAFDLEESITKEEKEEVCLIQYVDLYYADGFLYFTVEYSDYDEEASIGWRSGYRRLRSDVYRLKVGESAAQMLYSY